MIQMSALDWAIWAAGPDGDVDFSNYDEEGRLKNEQGRNEAGNLEAGDELSVLG